jgi:putative DNA methylase
MNDKKKLIEVALPLEAINKASAREKSIRHGHPSTLHLWWARRPLAAARAVIFAQMVDDPSAHPDLFPTEKAQEKERQRLFRIIEDLVLWENTTNEEVLERARAEIWQSWRAACAENADHPRVKELFNRHKLPAFHDPFAGGGALPLEAQRLGLEAYASDLNPVAVLINKAMIEIPPKFAGRAPVNPEARKNLFTAEGAEERRGMKKESDSALRTSAASAVNPLWFGARGLAEDVRYYGQWMRDEAQKRIGYLYPKIEITAEVAEGRRDLQPLVGQKLTVIAWLWARTVKSPNPAFAHVDVPLASTFMLSTKPGKEAYVEPVIENGGYRFTVKVGMPKDTEGAKLGTTLGKRAAFRCLMSDAPVTYDHIREQGKAGRMGARLMAIVAEGERGRVYLAPTPEHEAAALKAKPEWKPEVALPVNPRDFKTPNYGLTTFGDLFTPRQLVALTTFSDLVQEARGGGARLQRPCAELARDRALGPRGRQAERRAKGAFYRRGRRVTQRIERYEYQ